MVCEGKRRIKGQSYLYRDGEKVTRDIFFFSLAKLFMMFSAIMTTVQEFC